MNHVQSKQESGGNGLESVHMEDVLGELRGFSMTSHLLAKFVLLHNAFAKGMGHLLVTSQQ